MVVPIIKPKSKEGFYKGKELLLRELEERNKDKIADWVEDTIELMKKLKNGKQNMKINKVA